jgi:hypothetical protein
MSDLQTIQNELHSATTTLTDLRSALRDGADVDLGSFNTTVAATCNAAAALPKADALQVREQLEHLLAELNAARAEIVAEQEKLAADIASASGAGGQDAAQD